MVLAVIIPASFGGAAFQRIGLILATRPGRTRARSQPAVLLGCHASSWLQGNGVFVFHMAWTMTASLRATAILTALAVVLASIPLTHLVFWGAMTMSRDARFRQQLRSEGLIPSVSSAGANLGTRTGSTPLSSPGLAGASRRNPVSNDADHPDAGHPKETSAHI